MQTPHMNRKPSVSHKASTPLSRLLEIEREFRVPIQTLFEAFKTPEAIKAWWWPKGLYADRVDMKFEEGANYFINMKGHDQSGGGMTGQFEEIIENERIIMTDHFADQNGRAISAKEAKMEGTWPKTVYITFEFTQAGENASRVKLSQEGIPDELQSDCQKGWSEMFDKLETYLGDRNQ